MVIIATDANVKIISTGHFYLTGEKIYQAIIKKH